MIWPTKAHIRAKGEYQFRVIKQQFGFQKTRLRGIVKNSYRVNVLASLTNLFLARHQLLCRTCFDEWCADRDQNGAKRAGEMNQKR